MVRFVATRGVPSIGLVSDASPRSTQAAAIVRGAAQRERVAVAAPGAPGNPLFIVSGWAGAEAALRDIAAGRTAAQGAYLAAPALRESVELAERLHRRVAHVLSLTGARSPTDRFAGVLPRHLAG